MPSDNRRRFAFFGIALFAHAIVFYLVCHLTIFPAAPVVTDDSSFQRIAIPVRPPAPPTAPSASGPQMPSLLPPTVATPAPVVPIVSTMPQNTFTMPKIDTAAMDNAMARLPTPTNTASGANSGSNTSSGNLGTGGFATASSAEMEAFLHGDTRPGLIIGYFTLCMNASNEAAQMDSIRQKDITSIGWIISQPDPGHGAPGLKYGTDVSLLIQHPEKFAGYIDELMFPQIIRLRLHNILTQASQVKTLVLVWDFKGDYDPGHGRDSEGALYADIVAQLHAQNVRLCVISFENPPPPPLLQYVKESGGAVLYPKGVPTDDTASQLLRDTER